MAVHSYDGSFLIDDQAYLVNGSTIVFSVTAITLSPADAALESTFQYSAIRKDPASTLPSYITFDDSSLDFTIMSSGEITPDY